MRTVRGPLAAALFLSGCSLMPAYERPAAPVPAQWPASAGAADQAAAAATAAAQAAQERFMVILRQEVNYEIQKAIGRAK